MFQVASLASAVRYVEIGRNESFISLAKSKGLPNAEFYHDSKYTVCMSGIETAVFNAVWQHLPTPPSEDELEKIRERFKSKGLPFFWWELPVQIDEKNKHKHKSPLPHDTDILSQKGIQPAGNLKGICANLANVPDTIALPTGVDVEKVQSDKDFKCLCDLICSIFGLGQILAGQFCKALEAAGHKGDFVHYIAYKNRIPVGGISVSTCMNSAGLWNFAVQEDHRRCGIGTALVLTALKEAKSLGYSDVMAILTSDTSLWQKCGFQEVCHFPVHVCGVDA